MCGVKKIRFKCSYNIYILIFILYIYIYLLYSLHELLAGLFHRGISQSGTALCTWALAANGSSSYQAKKLASLLGCPTSPTTDLVNCLRTKDARDSIATDKQFMVRMHGPQHMKGQARHLPSPRIFKKLK
jgi:carboxylesterase type B